MTPLDALARILLLSQSLDRTFTASPEARLPQVSIGQQVSAKVEELLQNGNFRVSINGQPLQMSLPQSTRPGDSIGLVLIGREPRLTFRLDLPPQNAPALSNAGRLVSQLLPDAARPNPPLTQANPVLPSPPSSPGRLAQALQNTLSQSGLFYESHQAQWAMGERSLSQLLLEPQNAGMPTAPPPRTILRDLHALPAASMQAGLQQIIPSSSDARAGAPDASSKALDQVTLKPELLPIVRQQIEALETHEFNWSGQIWPGQTMDWQVSEDDQGQSPAGEPPSAWQSRIKLVLPMLGEICASLKLAPSGVQISLQVEKQEAESRLKASGKSLQESLEAGGIPLVSMTVRHHG